MYLQALFDLEFGHKVGHIVSNMRNDIITILKSKGKSKKKSLNEGDELQAAEKNAENPSRYDFSFLKISALRT